MAGDYGKFKVGNLVFPLDPTSVLANPLLAMDPATYYLLDYCEQMIKIHAGQAWNAVVTSIGFPDVDLTDKIVAHKLPYNPINYFQEEEAPFPLLAIYRESVQHQGHTFSWYKNIESWKIVYALFPLTPAQNESLNPFLKIISTILNDRLLQGYDPAYNAGQEVMSQAFGGIDTIDIKESKFLNFQFNNNTNLSFPTLSMSLDVTFREAHQRNFLQELAGADINQNLIAPEGITNNLIQNSIPL